MLTPTTSGSRLQARTAPFLLLLAACGGLVVDSEIENPTLLNLRVRQHVSPIMGAIVIEAVTADDFVPGGTTRLSASVQVEGQPEVSLLLWPRLCYDANNQPFSCREFSVILKQGRTLDELAGLLPRIGGRIISVLNDGLHVNVAIMGGDVAQVVAVAKQWTGVENAYLNYVGTVYQNVQPNREMRGYVPADTSVLGTETITLETGDTVTVQYRQPDGLVLAVSQPVTITAAIVN